MGLHEKKIYIQPRNRGEDSLANVSVRSSEFLRRLSASLKPPTAVGYRVEKRIKFIFPQLEIRTRTRKRRKTTTTTTERETEGLKLDHSSYVQRSAYAL